MCREVIGQGLLALEWADQAWSAWKMAVPTADSSKVHAKRVLAVEDCLPEENQEDAPD